MVATAMVHVRVDEQIKEQATETLAMMGLSLSDAVRVFLMRVVADQQMPFALRAPNAETRSAMAEADYIARAHRARFANAAEPFEVLEKNEIQHIENIRLYLAAGHGRGRLASAATTYCGKVGYFFVESAQINGVRMDCIKFSCMPYDDIMVTDLSAFECLPLKGKDVD